MKKRIISMLLVVAAVLSMIVVPVGAYDVTVDTTGTTETCKCGCGQTLANIDWQPWDVNTTGDPASGHFYLEGNYAQDEQITVISGESVVLDLRGYTLTTNGYHRLALVYGYMAVLDTVGGGRFCAKTSGGGNGGVVMVGINETADPTFELWSGTVTVDADNKSALRGGLITVGEDCNFRMYGGMLLNGSTTTNSAGDLQNGGAIAATATNSTIEILGGSIIGCSATGSGGSIYSKGTTILKNCQIIGGTSTGGFGGNIYQDGGKLIMENCTVRDGVSNRNTSTKNGGGNITVLNSGTATITGCTIANGYAAYNGGNLFLGSGTATLDDCTVYGGTAGLNGGNIACNSSSNTTTITDCTIAGDMEYSAGSLTLSGKTTIGLVNTGLNVADTSVNVDASGLTEGSQIYVKGNGISLTGGNIDYFLPVQRTLLTSTDTGISAAFAASGEEGGYCPHCGDKVVWTVFNDNCYLDECLNDSDGDTDPTCTKRHIKSGHYYLAGDKTAFAQHYAGVVQTHKQGTPDDTSDDVTNKIPYHVVIDLAGYDITASARAFYVHQGSLTLLDSSGESVVTGKGTTAAQGGGVLYNDGQTLNVYGGKYVLDFDSTRGLTSGGVVYNGGTFNLYGGILDGSAYNKTAATNSNGGALYMGTGSSRVFNMSAGRIIGGTAYLGGSIYVNYNNNITITGGSITGGNAVSSGGNIYFYGESSKKSGVANITGCSITDGGFTAVEGVSPAGGGNIQVSYNTVNLTDCYVAGGTATAYGGNLSCGNSGKATVTDTIINNGYAGKGGNMYTASTSADLTLTNAAVLSGTAVNEAGNIHANNGYITVEGGLIAFGTAGSYAGNVYANAGNYKETNYTEFICDEDGNAPQILGGTAGTYGGNIYARGITTLDAAYIGGGSAGTLGQDVYIASANVSLTVGSGVTGNILLGAPTALLGDPVYGNPISTVACEDLDADIYLEGDYDLPDLCVSGGALCVGAFAMEKSNGEVVWYTTAADAVAAAEENELVRVYVDCAIETDKDLYLDVGGSTVTVTGTGKIYGMDSSGDDYALPTGSIVWASADAVNTDPVTYAPNGNMYITVTDGNTSTYHRLNQYIGAVSLRTSCAGIYYTGVWACDSVVKGMIDSYGVAVSLEGMPTAAFATEDNGNMWTEAEEELEVGVNSTSVLISGIMKSAEENRTAELNDRYGKMDIYATTYVKMTDGTVYISDDSTTKDDDVAYSLYDAMALLDERIVNDPNNFRRYTNQVRQFRDAWADFGMADWTDFQKIVTPEEDGVIDVLMIGSSFCYYYVEELASLAAAAGLEMRVCNVYYSGCKLYQHYNWWVAGESNYQFYETTVQDDGTVSRVKTTPASLEWCLNQGEWDVISLQESSSQLRTSGGVQAHWENTQVYRDALFPYLQTQFPDAQILWHQTWSYQIGYDRSGYQMQTLEQQLADMQEMKDFSILLGEEYGIGRVPTGSAWMNVRQGTCGDAYDNLCARLAKENGVGDYYHDGDIGGGQYLNACVWFEVITGLDCREIDSYVPTYETDTLSDSVLGSVYVDAVEGGYALQKDFMDLLQECAHQAVAEMQAETEE